MSILDHTVTEERVGLPGLNEVDNFFSFQDNIYKRRSYEEIKTLSHIKRFLERYQGDESIRNNILLGYTSFDDAARDCGVDIDIETLLPIFHPDYIHIRSAMTREEWPLAFVWDVYIKECLLQRDKIRLIGDSAGYNPNFDDWRNRQINRTALLLGLGSVGIVHPPVAFELSEGCSVGCWFCGLSAEKFRGHFSLAGGGASFWKDILRATQSVLGRGLASGFCYWATDPLDNPEYTDFLKIYQEISGVVPQTTTAIPLRNIGMTREMMELQNTYRSHVNRFSVLTTKILKEIHSTFSAEEMLRTELVLQNKGSNLVKSSAGKAYQENVSGSVNQPRSEKGFKIVESTIACVSGFIINIYTRRIRLVSPTLPSNEWPDGYIVFEENTFQDGEDLESIMKEMVEKFMQPSLKSHSKIKFTEGCHYSQDGSGSFLRSKNIRIETTYLGRVGEMISRGDHSPIEILKLATNAGSDPLKVFTAICDARQSGLIEYTESPLL